MYKDGKGDILREAKQDEIKAWEARLAVLEAPSDEALGEEKKKAPRTATRTDVDAIKSMLTGGVNVKLHTEPGKYEMRNFSVDHSLNYIVCRPLREKIKADHKWVVLWIRDIQKGPQSPILAKTDSRRIKPDTLLVLFVRRKAKKAKLGVMNETLSLQFIDKTERDEWARAIEVLWRHKQDVAKQQQAKSTSPTK